jgi:hypothetical protein
MPIKRITISVPEEVARRIRDAAGDTPVSTWVTELIEEHLDDQELERRWEAFYREVSPSAADERRAATLLRRLTRSPKRRAAGS